MFAQLRKYAKELTRFDHSNSPHRPGVINPRWYHVLIVILCKYKEIHEQKTRVRSGSRLPCHLPVGWRRKTKSPRLTPTVFLGIAEFF